MDTLSNHSFFSKVADLIKEAQNSILKTVNRTMVLTYYQIGKMIVEEEQKGKDRAIYGESLIISLSSSLTNDFGKGFSVTNIQQMRKFYLIYSKQQTVSASSQKQQTTSAVSIKDTIMDQVFNLSWSHYVKLMRIEDENERNFYEIESFRNNWSVRELQRQYDTALYTRLSLSKNKDEILNLSKQGLMIESPKDVIKDPYMLDFLGLSEKTEYSESQLEQELINKLEYFLLELGTGFSFVARQKRISFDDKHFRIDLVFYNRIIKSFVLIDLKIGELKHQDIGQMQMYVNYYDREVKLEDENRTIGLILCQNKNDSIVKYTLPEDNEHIFASKYYTVLPSREDLKRLIDKD